jgi:hypothetical protein
MAIRSSTFESVNLVACIALMVACGSSDNAGTGSGGGAGNSAPLGGGGSAGNSGAAPMTGGSSGNGGGAAAGSAGSSSVAGSAAGGSPFGGAGNEPPEYELDCGKEGWAVESHGPPSNRVNHVIVGDGYTAQTVETELVAHINEAMDRRFNHESGEPYGRYRKFVNICVMKAISANNGIGNGPTAFDGGNGGDRLAAVNESKVEDYLEKNLPADFEVDWKAVVLNQDLWENTGAILMLWSGAHADSAGANLHEGGHGFHQLADEYCAKATGSSCGDDTNGSGSAGDGYAEVNSAGDPTTTDDKWTLWLGTMQKGLKVPDMGATGLQSTFVGSRYVDNGQYRPSSNSMMNSLFGLNMNTSFNSVSREQIIFSIWRAVVPIDSTEPPAGSVTAPAVLKVNVIDPAVINVDWTVDGVTTVNAGTSFDTSSLATGSHTVSAKAYDNASMDLVRNRSSECPPAVTGRYCHGTSWSRSEQTVTWTVTK